MNKTFNIYCDESTHMVHDGHPYMLLGCTSIAYTQIRMAKDAIKDIKKKHGYSDELKWTKGIGKENEEEIADTDIKSARPELHQRQPGLETPSIYR